MASFEDRLDGLAAGVPPAVAGVHHVALTVRDVDASARWYGALFGLDPVQERRGDEGDVSILANESLLLGLRRHPGTDGEDGFDHRRVGLDHVAIGCADAGSIAAWAERLRAQGIDHSGPESSAFGIHLNLRDPDGIAIELFAPASA
jgi:glyoxylase I family protein